MVENSGKIIVKNNDGEEVVCNVLFTFDNDETKKSYIVFTDNSRDDLDNLRVYANTYNKNKDNGNLGDIETDKEWALIEQIFNSVVNIKGENNE